MSTRRGRGTELPGLNSRVVREKPHSTVRMLGWIQLLALLRNNPSVLLCRRKSSAWALSPNPGQCLCPRALGTAACLPGNALIYPKKEEKQNKRGFFSQPSQQYFSCFFSAEPSLALP